jgi:hypothetical protein
MKTLFTAEAISMGGRSGTIRNPDGLLDITLGNPLEKGIERRGPNPELLKASTMNEWAHSEAHGRSQQSGNGIGFQPPGRTQGNERLGGKNPCGH